MSKIFKRVGLFASSCIALAGIAGFVTACADAQPTLVVLYTVARDDSCVAAPGENNRITSDVADVSLGLDAVAAFVLTNNQPDVNAGDSNTGTNTSEVKMRDVDVRLSLPQVEGFEPIKYNLPISNDSITGGDEFVYSVRVPSMYLEQLRPLVPAGGDLIMKMTVVFHGLRSSNAVGDDLGVIDSRPYSFPFLLCDGCLAPRCQDTFATDDPMTNVCTGNCNLGNVEEVCGTANEIYPKPRCCDGEAYTVAECQ